MGKLKMSSLFISPASFHSLPLSPSLSLFPCFLVVSDLHSKYYTLALSPTTGGELRITAGGSGWRVTPAGTNTAFVRKKKKFKVSLGLCSPLEISPPLLLSRCWIVGFQGGRVVVVV